ncbi:MAG TPA: aldo/keto reductase [Acidimicrobiales bacterium]|nr:aldo/keto reductase [Acidimicrobiales bacterium]
MRYRTLGRTGMQVSTLCLGTMMFGAWGNPDEAACRRIVDLALDAGINFVDTADVYDRGVSEEIVGRALEGRRDRVVLTTKVFNPMGEDPNERGASRRWIVAEVEASLRRLRTDWIDCYLVHRPDPATDLDETLGAMSDLVHAGKVRAIGCSTFPAELLVEADFVARARGRERFAVEQPPYSIFARGIEGHVLPTAQRLGLGVMVWAPLNGGWLSGKYRRGRDVAPDARAVREAEHFDWGRPEAEVKLSLVEQLEKLAAEAGCSLAHLALAFVLEHPAVTSAIIGPRTPEQLTSLLGAEEVVLPDAVLDRIDELVAPGTDVNPMNAGYVPPALVEPSLRRRRAGPAR